MSSALSISILLISLMQSVDGTQFLNITPLFLLSFSIDVFICTAVLPAGGPTCPVIVVVPFKVYMHHKNQINLTLKL